MPTSPGVLLLVSGINEQGPGGLFVVDGDEMTVVDQVDTTGLAVDADRIGRLMPAVAEDASELLIYDATGVLEYRRLDDVADPHDLVSLDDESWIVVSSTDNAVLRVGPDGGLTTVWRPSTAPDSWHLNCVTVVDGDLWVSGFGHFDQTRGWDGGAGIGAGFIRNLTTGAELGGLSFPHSHRWVDGGWIVCNSLKGSVVSWEPLSGEWRAIVEGLRYPRGLAAVGGRLYVGESGWRGRPDEKGGVAVVEDGAVVSRVSLPTAEVYDVVPVSAGLVRGLLRGFDTNSERVGMASTNVAVWPASARGVAEVGASMDPSALASRVECKPPTTITRSVTVPLSVTVHNTGATALTSANPFPVFLSYRWLDGPGGEVEGRRQRLGRILAPDGKVQIDIDLEAPTVPGEYTLSVSLVKEGMVWFDEIDLDNGFRSQVHIA